MPRVHHVKKARRGVPSIGVKPGDSYYWWANRAPGSRSGVKRYSKTPPKPSQTTGNPFYAELYSIQEDIGEATPEDLADLQEMRDDWVQRVNDLAQEQRDKFDNMPEGLQQGETGQLLEERADALEQWASDLEGVDIPDELEDADPAENATAEERMADAVQAALDDLQATDCGL
jgi:hypothetical protein